MLHHRDAPCALACNMFFTMCTFCCTLKNMSLKCTLGMKLRKAAQREARDARERVRCGLATLLAVALPLFVTCASLTDAQISSLVPQEQILHRVPRRHQRTGDARARAEVARRGRADLRAHGHGP